MVPMLPAHIWVIILVVIVVWILIPKGRRRQTGQRECDRCGMEQPGYASYCRRCGKKLKS